MVVDSKQFHLAGRARERWARRLGISAGPDGTALCLKLTRDLTLFPELWGHRGGHRKIVTWTVATCKYASGFGLGRAGGGTDV